MTIATINRLHLTRCHVRNINTKASKTVEPKYVDVDYLTLPTAEKINRKRRLQLRETIITEPYYDSTPHTILYIIPHSQGMSHFSHQDIVHFFPPIGKKITK